MLPIFPEGSLVSSVVTTTWVGVFVLCFFNLRLGWVLSGIVVPGYLVPLLLVKPWAAVVITGEAMVTYLVVFALSERASKLGIWNSLFGRDHFFAIILASIGVRLLFDGWLLPQIGAAVNDAFGLSFDYRNELHSFGLIIVALMANQFWKPGLVRSIIPTVVTVGITFLIVRFGLVELTNFRMADLGFMYADLAASILATPKAYIVLVVTAFLASRMNLIYGWDFNGILIPALIALQWWQPWKVAASFVEAFIIYGLGAALLSLPIFANASVEGARKLLLFFNVSFAYKLALGWGLAIFAPGVKVTDYFAFGYLLSTLLAIKMHDKAIPTRLTRATLQTSLTGVAAASVIGFALTLFPAMAWRDSGAAATDAPAIASGPTLGEHIDRMAIEAYAAGVKAELTRPTPTEVADLQRAAAGLIQHAQGQDGAGLGPVRRRLAAAGYQLHRLDGNHLAAIDAQPGRGWSSLVVRTGPAADLVVEVPDARVRPQLAEAALGLYRTMVARVLVVAGSSRSALKNPALDPLTHRQSAFHAFHRAAANRNVVQVRGASGNNSAAAEVNELVVQSSLPEGMAVNRLQERLRRLEVRFGTGPGSNAQRASMWQGFAELFLTPEGVARLVGAQPGQPARAAPPLAVTKSRDLAALFEEAGKAAPEGSGDYRVPSLAELLYFDTEVLTPLLRAAKTGLQDGEWSDAARATLTRVQSAAEAVGYRVRRHSQGGQEYLVLVEAAGGSRSWGTLVIRTGPAANLGIQVPRPLMELRTLATGRDLFQRSQARALLVAGAHPRAVPNRQADVLRQRNGANVFNLMSQVLYRESGNAAFTGVQVRGFAPRPTADPADQPRIVVATADGAADWADLSAQERHVTDLLTSGEGVAFADGSPAVAGLDVAQAPQAGYLDQAENDAFVTLWLARGVRSGYRDKLTDGLEAAQFKALAMADRRADPASDLAGTPLASAPPAGLRAMVRRYTASRDILALEQLQAQWPRYRYERLVDPQTRRSYLLVWTADDRLALAASLAPNAPWSVTRIDADTLHARDWAALVRERGGALISGRGE